MLLRVPIAMISPLWVASLLLIGDTFAQENGAAQIPLRSCQAQTSDTKQVAIIGAGSAGASTAYYLQKSNPQQKLNITIYERSDYVGGRSTTAYIFDDLEQPLELGGSIFVKVNHNLVTAAHDFGLAYSPPYTDGPGDSADALGIWDGEIFRFKQPRGTSWWWDLTKLFWKYGLSPYRVNSLMKKTVGSFLELYEPPYFPFYSLGSVAAKVGLNDALGSTGQEFLEKNGISTEFATDIVQASTLVNYAQSLGQLHGLETMVCMATEGAVSVSGGNWRIFDGMIRSSGANLLLGHAVSEISRQDDGHLLLTASDVESEESFSHTYDHVVIAAPYQFSDITINPTPAIVPQKINYVQLHVTLFTSPHKLSPAYFAVDSSDANVPEFIITTLPGNNTSGPHGAPSTSLPFFSISTLRHTWNKDHYPPRLEFAYKIFSPAPLNASFLSSVLGFESDLPGNVSVSEIPSKHISWFREKVWHSYPYLDTLQGEDAFDGPALSKGLWYTSGVERFISTMETSSWMGKNVAALITKEWDADAKECLAGEEEENRKLECAEVQRQCVVAEEKCREWESTRMGSYEDCRRAEIICKKTKVSCRWKQQEQLKSEL